MRKYFTIGLLLISINGVLSQNTDSLRRVLSYKQKEEKVNLLLALSKAYWYSNRDTALLYASEAMNGENKSIKINDLIDAPGSAAGTKVVLKIPMAQEEIY